MQKLLVGIKKTKGNSVDMHLKILEQQYQAVLSGSTIPGDDPCIVQWWNSNVIVEMKKPKAALLPKPMDIVGDEEVARPIQKKKKAGKKKEEKKTWSREDILNTFLPPTKQKSLQKGKQEKKKTVEKEKKEKKSMPKVVMKEKTEDENATKENQGMNEGELILQSLMNRKGRINPLYYELHSDGTHSQMGTEYF